MGGVGVAVSVFSRSAVATRAARASAASSRSWPFLPQIELIVRLDVETLILAKQETTSTPPVRMPRQETQHRQRYWRRVSPKSVAT